MSDLIFDIQTPLGFKVRCSKSYWENTILRKHNVLKGKVDEIIETLKNPSSIRQSQKDESVYLFYTGSSPRWMCAVIKSKDEYGFLITAYPTDAIKEGREIWKK